MEAAIEIAGRVGNTAYSDALLRRVRDFAQIKAMDNQIARYALKHDAHGLDEMDNKILNTIIDKFKEVQLVCLR
jgi:Holliday junction DNA helicase RuvB